MQLFEKEAGWENDLGNFKRSQRLAFEAAEYTRDKLYVGITEKEAAAIMEDYINDKGVANFFHHSFAWFGDRTRFLHFDRPNPALQAFPPNVLEMVGAQLELPHFGRQFQPSGRKLEEGMAVILDVAPAIDGCAADIGYAFAFGSNPAVEQAVQDLKGFRSLILDGVKAEKTLSAIYYEVDKLISELGYENAHSYYPGAVLGHLVGKVPLHQVSGLTYMGFDLQTILYLGAEAGKGMLRQLFGNGDSPLWGPQSDYRATPGLWAIEPHIGKDDFGVKWEEILVVTENNAYWLDDESPHMRAWQTAGKEAAVK